jgi:hypothetical protein
MNATISENTSTSGMAAIQSIVSHRSVAAPIAQVWNSLRFYEELDHKPPFLLRLLLPRPQRTVTSPKTVGEQTTLPYDSGHYSKQVTKLEAPHRYEFDVTEQRMRSDRGVLLLSGAYTLRELSATQTDLSITTRYASGIRPRWFAEPVERLLCRRLQRHLLDAVEAKAGQ